MTEQSMLNRKEHLHDALGKLRMASSPLMIRNPSNKLGRPTHIYAESYFNYSFIKQEKLEAPFPTTTEVLTWPILEGFIERDVPIEEIELAFDELRDGIVQDIFSWKFHSKTR